jgi:hypothetical protein
MAAAKPAGPAPTQIISYLRMTYSVAVILDSRFLRLLKKQNTLPAELAGVMECWSNGVLDLATTDVQNRFYGRNDRFNICRINEFQ